jgi:hypothetical protein
MKTFRQCLIVAGGALLAVGLTSHAARAFYDSTDTRLPSPYYRATNAVVYPTPGGPVTIDSFFDVFPDAVRAPGPPEGSPPQTDSFFDIFTELSLEPLGAPQNFRESPSRPTIQTARLNGLPPGTPVTFNTEMLALDIPAGSGNNTLPPGVMIRESPTLASTGKTAITDQGGGVFRIDSFFDVFTELSVDNGASWIPSNSPMHLEGTNSIPEPSTLMLVGLCLIGGTAIRRTRRDR